MKNLVHIEAQGLKGIAALPQTDRNYISFAERLAQFGASCDDITAAQIWKSLHVVAGIAMAVLTRTREISTCPHHIPALTLNNTRLLSKLNPALHPLPEKVIQRARSFFTTAY